MSEITNIALGHYILSPISMGGYAAILSFNGFSKRITGLLRITSSDRAETYALLSAMSLMKRPTTINVSTNSPCIPIIFSSLNVAESIDFDVPDGDLWRKLSPLLSLYSVSFSINETQEANELAKISYNVALD